MQKKAKQLVHIYKPAHDSPLASAAILVHTKDNAATKGKSSQPKSNQHQLAPINHPQENPNTGDGDYSGGQRGRGRGHDRGTRGRGSGGNSNNRYEHQERGHGRGQGQRDFQYNKGRGHQQVSRHFLYHLLTPTKFNFNRPLCHKIGETKVQKGNKSSLPK